MFRALLAGGVRCGREGDPFGVGLGRFVEGRRGDVIGDGGSGPVGEPTDCDAGQQAESSNEPARAKYA